MKGNSHIVINLIASPLCAYGCYKFLAAAQTHPITASSIMVTGTIISSKLPDQIEVLKFLGHRTWSHSILPVLAAALLIILTPNPAWVLQVTLLSLLTGYTLHLAADMCSVTGIPLLISGFRIRIPLYTTGKISELITLVLFGSVLLYADSKIIILHTWFNQGLQILKSHHINLS